MESLEEILAGGEKVVPEEGEKQTIEQPQQEKPDGPPRDESGKFISKGVEEGAPPAPKTDQLPPEEYKALKAEREKRQSLEAKLAELEQRLQQPKEPPAPPPSIWDDEQGAFNHLGQSVLQQSAVMNRLQTSEMLMHQAHPDFADMQKVFVSMLETSPQLREVVMSDPHPWNKAYQIAKNHQTMQELGATDIDTLKARLREELKAEMATTAPKPVVPVSLTSERNVGARTGPAWSGPPSLSDILGS